MVLFFRLLKLIKLFITAVMHVDKILRHNDVPTKVVVACSGYYNKTTFCPVVTFVPLCLHHFGASEVNTARSNTLKRNFVLNKWTKFW